MNELVVPDAPAANGRPDSLTFQAFRGRDGLERLAPEWRKLAESIPGVRFNHFPEWYGAYLSSLESDPDRVWFIAAHRGRGLAGIFPLHFQDFQVPLFKPRVLGTIEDDQMQLSDFSYPQLVENQNLLHLLTQWLRTQRNLQWDALRLLRVSEDSSIAYSASARLPRAAVGVRHYTSAFFKTVGTYEQATHAMTAKFKSNLRRRNRIAQQTAPLRHQVYRREGLCDAFQIFLDIEASGWKGEHGTSSAIRCVPPMLAFYSSLVREFRTRDECVINLLWRGEEAVAGQFCLQIGRTVYILKVGFSEAHSKIAPGVLLLERMIRFACDDPGIDVLHLLNEPSWATFFRPEIKGVWSYFAPNWSARGVLAHFALLAKCWHDDRVRKRSVDHAARIAAKRENREPEDTRVAGR